MMAPRLHPVALAFAGLILCPAVADTINVPADHPTIEAAITASASGDVILIAAGTYYEANLTTRGRAITVQGTLNEDGSLATTIDAQQVGRVFRIGTNEGSGTVIRDLIITGGLDYQGGGIYCFLTNPTIRNCRITDNSAQFGGGIYCRGASPTIIDCRITNNSSNVELGNTAGIHLWGSFATFSGCTISDNPDGGIFCTDYGSGPYPTISDCSITGNAFGISCDSNGSPAIDDCTISDNDGNGIYSQLSSNPSISGCTITNNGGSGVYGFIWGSSFFDSTPIISGSIICGNQSGQLSGAYDDAGGNSVEEVCPIACIGDTNGDAVVDGADLAAMLAAWGQDVPSVDQNDDGQIDGQDLAVVLGAWGLPCGG